MTKRKKAGSDISDEDQSVPLPIQTFLWRQSSPFIRPKLGKQCEASCVSFERVLVQNILHGLSPSLCEAISSVSRWKLVQTAFPHVMHACTSMLQQRKQDGRQDTKFDALETKLLYTMHWIVLDAASECEDIDNEKARGPNQVTRSYMFPLEVTQLFVYLMAPLLSSMRDQDFQTLKLENGLRLWQQLWSFRQPDVACFATPVKPKRNVLKAQRNLLRVNFNAGNIYIGKGTSNDNIYLGFEDPCQPASRASYCSAADASLALAPLARLSDICALSTTTNASTSVEIICEVCSQVVQSRNGEFSCQCGVRRGSFASFSADKGQAPKPEGPISPVDKDYVTKQLETAARVGPPGAPSQDVLSASYFDISVLRCLFCPQWAEEGVYWALRYLHQRLLEICDENSRVEYTRERSQSLPSPKMKVTETHSQPPSPSSPLSPKYPADHVLNKPDSAMFPLPDTHSRREPAFKRVKVGSELKEIFEKKVKPLIRRQSAEQFDLEVHSSRGDSGRTSPEYSANLNADSGAAAPQRPNSALAKLNEEEDSIDDDRDSCHSDSGSDLIGGRRKSMPHIQRRKKYSAGDEDDDDDSSSGKQPLLPRQPAEKVERLCKPIITITEDSPDPTRSPSWMSKRESLASGQSFRSDNSHRPLTLQRSLTDSNINYKQEEEVAEVPGSVFYIQNDGQLNYEVILQAVHCVSSRECTPRTCGVILNIINCLLDLDVIEKKRNEEPPKDEKDDSNNNHATQLNKNKHKKSGKKEKEKDEKEEKNKKNKDEENEKKEKPTNHAIAMETVVRIFRWIGCPYGCGDGVRGGVGDHLRAQGLGCLGRLNNNHSIWFAKFLRMTFIKQPLQDIIDFLHALQGFCVDPAANVISPQAGKKPEVGKTGGYANNFGEPIGGGTRVDAVIITQILKPLLSRLVESRKELQGHENIGLYCDVKQFLNFIKETKGGTFRRVALSGLLDAVDRTPGKKTKTTKVVRRTLSMASRDENGQSGHPGQQDDSGNAKARRTLFKKKTRKIPGRAYGRGRHRNYKHV